MRSPARHVPGSRSGLIAWVVICQMLFSALGGYATFQAGAYDRVLTGGLKQTREHVEEGTWIGWTERDLRAKLGPPAKAYGRYLPVGPMRTDLAIPVDATTLVYRHERGCLYIWQAPHGEGAVCFDSLWFDKGVQF